MLQGNVSRSVHNDAEYYSVRAIEEQLAARNASCEAARERHEELAAMYRFRSAMVATVPLWSDDVDDRWPEDEVAETAVRVMA